MTAAISGSALGPAARPRRAVTRPYQEIADSDRGTGGESLANFLGIFSIGLGMAQVLAPEGMSKVCGIRDAEGNANLMRLMGMREISHGIALLTNPQPEKAAWAREATAATSQ